MAGVNAKETSEIGSPDDGGGVVGCSEWLWLKPEDRRRIVACVNFCAGEDVEYLESAGMGESVRLRGSLDELADAAQEPQP
jgi:hypothetical protein